MKVIRNDELAQSNNSLEFEGADHDGVGVSFFPAQVVVVPAGEPHGFSASGDGSRQVNVHVSPRFVTQWLEEEAYG